MERIALLTGGGDRPYAHGLAVSLSEAGVPLDFIGSDFLESEELRARRDVRFLNLRGDMSPDVPPVRKTLRVLQYYARLLAYAVRSDAPVFHILWNNRFEAFDRTVLMWFYRRLGKRIIRTVHNINAAERDGCDNAFNRWTLKAQYAMSDHLFVHTQPMKQQLIDQFGVSEAAITVIPFGINDTVPQTDLSQAEARQQLGLGSNERVLLFFGNIAPYKGVEFLIDAFASLARQRSDYRLVIAGRPKGAEPYWESIVSRIRDLGIEDRILRRIEYVPDDNTEIFFKAADVLILPYTHVFQSGVLFLAYNFGLPVIASDVGSLREDIVEQRTGFVCEPRNAESLESAIRSFFEGSLWQGRDDVRADIKRYASERYSWSSIAAVTSNVYARLLARIGPRSWSACRSHLPRG